jgi:hypothetical protein
MQMLGKGTAGSFSSVNMSRLLQCAESACQLSAPAPPSVFALARHRGAYGRVERKASAAPQPQARQGRARSEIV